MAAAHGLQVFRLTSRAKDVRNGSAAVPLGRLYGSETWKRIGNVELRLRSPVSRIVIEDGSVRGVIAGEQECAAISTSARCLRTRQYSGA
jgi:hypothetical protein